MSRAVLLAANDYARAVSAHYGGVSADTLITLTRAVTAATAPFFQLEEPMALQATEGRVIVLRDPAQEVTKGGIVIPDSGKERPTTGSVVHVGPGEYLESGKRKLPPCEIGDRVLFSPYAGTTYEDDDGAEYQILGYTELLAVLR